MTDESVSAPTNQPFDHPSVDAPFVPVGNDFLLPYIEPFGRVVSDPREAEWVWALNDTSPDAPERLEAARAWRKPIAWWNIEDPNWFEAFFPQAVFADYVFTSDEACISRYVERLGHDRVFWLPLACSPSLHVPLEIAPDAADFVLSANWYENDARKWSVATIVDPLIQADYSLSLFSYEDFVWPSSYQKFWRGSAPYRETALQYREGRVALGLNNQRSGFDGIGKTVMTSMRTFEALACGKPLLTSASDAYERLGLRNGVHLIASSSKEETLYWGAELLQPEGEVIAERGRELVLQNHTYGHRLASMGDAVFG